jgi:putative RecB family exonuclease
VKTEEEWGRIAKKEYRSPSQLNEYEKCPYAYFLNRKRRVWQRPAAWLQHGTAVHRAIELWEQSGRTKTEDEVIQDFKDSYNEGIKDDLRKTPNINEWFPSGPYRAPRDIPRRFQLGQQHVLNVLKFYREHPDMKPWVDPEGKMWVEKEFVVKFGDVEVVGYVDVVIDEIPYDYKTGNTPGGPEQLATYAGVLNLKFGIPFTDAFYFMTKLGSPTRAYDISDWSIQRLADVYGELDQNVKAENFPPKPSADNCRICPVSTSCEFGKEYVGG